MANVRMNETKHTAFLVFHHHVLNCVYFKDQSYDVQHRVYDAQSVKMTICEKVVKSEKNINSKCEN